MRRGKSRLRIVSNALIPICTLLDGSYRVIVTRRSVSTDIDPFGWAMRFYGFISTIEHSIQLYAQTHIIIHVDICGEKTHPARSAALWLI